MGDDSAEDDTWCGHSVLQLPVPALEWFVRERTAHYDAGFLVDDPAYTHAHITALVPFRAALGLGDAELIAAICRDTPPIPIELRDIHVTSNGLIVLRPEPDEPLRELSAKLGKAFPECVPYWGRHGEVAPHLTLDAVSEEVDVEWVRAALADVLPVNVVLNELQLVWYESGRCGLLRRWALGDSEPFDDRTSAPAGSHGPEVSSLGADSPHRPR